MTCLIEDYLDRLLSPNAIDPHWIAMILLPHKPECTLHELKIWAAERAARDGYECVYQGPYWSAAS